MTFHIFSRFYNRRIAQMGISVSTSQQMRRLQFMQYNRAQQNSFKADPSTVDIENLHPTQYLSPQPIMVSCKGQSQSQGNAYNLGQKGIAVQAEAGIQEINFEERVFRQRKENSTALRGSRQNILNAVEPLNISRLSQRERMESPPTIRSKKVKLNK